MSEVRDRGGGRVVIRRCFAHSRHEVEFTAVAYEIVVPSIKRGPSACFGDARRQYRREFDSIRSERRMA